MLQQETALTELPNDLAWKKYCGFLGLSIQGFLEVQAQQLLAYLPALARSGVGRHFLDGKILRTVREYRRLMPLTSYGDYLPFLRPEPEADLSEPPVFWAQTTRGNGNFARIPYTQTAFDQLMDSAIALIFLASATGKGKICLEPGNRILYNFPPQPYLSGILAEGLASHINLRSVLTQEETRGMDFQDKIALGFTTALRSGVDVVASMTGVLLKIGEEFEQQTRRRSWSRELLHPKVAMRLLRALVVSRLQHRPILPKDLWPVKALICWGMDTALYRQQLKEYWGCEPFEFAATTEAGILAAQSWLRQGMTFLPTTNFLEFIPECETLHTNGKSDAGIETLLLNQLEVGKRYEVVITSCTGMPFLRYRLGHLMEVLALREEATGIDLPQVRFLGRIDSIIDIAGFTRIDEQTLHRAVQTMGVPMENWAARKEVQTGTLVLRFYMEPQNGYPWDLAERLQRSLTEQDPFYRDLDAMLGMRPLQVTTLAPGTFQRYYESKRDAGVELAQRQPAKVNPSDEEIHELLYLGEYALP